MRVLVVDDSRDRVDLIRCAMKKWPFFKYLDVVYCDSADGARRELTAHFDLLLLDILIPKKTNGVPQARYSATLLSDVCDPGEKYVRPNLVIGLTADIEELGTYQGEFAKHASVVLPGNLHELGWLDSLQYHIESLLSSRQKIMQKERDLLLISIHGIRTFGQWQAKLSQDLKLSSREFECIEIKFGFLGVISFAIPYLRRKVVNRTAQRVSKILSEQMAREVHIVAHSFGTFVALEALRHSVIRGKLKTVIFCGSPLPHDENIDHVVSSAEVTLNECGTRDFILLMARFLLLGCGDAGRVGFERENSSNFQNRYFKGGHSLYFRREKRGNLTFCDRFWLRFIVAGDLPEPYDARGSFIGEDLADLIVDVLTLAKPLLYVSAPVLLGLVLLRLA